MKLRNDLHCEKKMVEILVLCHQAKILCHIFIAFLLNVLHVNVMYCGRDDALSSSFEMLLRFTQNFL